MAHIVGTSGDDTGSTALMGTNSDDLIEGLAGNDQLIGFAGNDVLKGGDGDDMLSNGLGNATLYGDAGNDTLYGGGGNDYLDGGTGTDTMNGGPGDDTYVVDNSGDVASELISGTDYGSNDTVLASVSYHIGEGIEKLVLTGFSDINATGNASDNTIIGNIGNNVLNGGGGGDTMYGLAGDDAYFVDSAADLVIENVDDGTDKVIASVDYALTANVENLTLAGGAVYGVGNVLDNVIVGTAGDNILQGGGGDDTLNGGSGADTMSGGTGNDLYYVNDSHDVVVENAGEGTDTVVSSLSRTTLAANVENLTLIAAAVSGAGNGLGNVITGNAGDNTLEGLGGADRLDGGAGADRMLGGAGNDTYIVDNAGDRAVETHDDRHDDGGHDLVRSSVSFQLGAFIEDLTLTGTGDINGFGNNLANVLTGNAGNNILSGGSGGDRMSGGAGNDTYVVENIHDVVVENAGEGTDMVLAKLSYNLTANVENLQLGGSGNFSATGNGLDNVIIGNAGNNTLDGGIGADHMSGGAGNDTYIVDNIHDVVSEQIVAGHDDGGIDTVQASVSFTLGAFFENLTLTGTGNIKGTGNSLNNRIAGNAGNNLIDGGLGADAMSGGKGDDTYVVDNAGDTVTELSNGGIDLVKSGVTYVLGANLENLTLTGTANIDATGNGLDNIIQGNSGNNHIESGNGFNHVYGGDGVDTLVGGTGPDWLDGGAGDDIMAGGAGNDTYVVDSLGDTITEAANAGADIVMAGMSYTLAANFEGLTLTGTGNFTATGNSATNTLIGNSGNNVLDGGGGRDNMAGGLGDDTYILTNVSDIVTESANGGTDTIWSSFNVGGLAANVENLTLTGSANIGASGNDDNNVLTGNAGNNFISGRGGDDRLTGGAGADIFHFGAGTGHDTIVDFSSVEGDKIQLDFTGDGNATVTQAGLDSLVDLGSGNTILVLNAHAADVQASIVLE